MTPQIGGFRVHLQHNIWVTSQFFYDFLGFFLITRRLPQLQVFWNDLIQSRKKRCWAFPFMHVSLFIREVTLSQKVHLPKDLPSGPIHQNWVLYLYPMCKGSWECSYTTFFSFFYHSRILPLRGSLGERLVGRQPTVSAKVYGVGKTFAGK